MTRDEVKNKLKTLTQGQFSDDVLGKMATTFVALANRADFEAVESATPPPEAEEPTEPKDKAPRDGQPARTPTGKEGAVRLGGLVYNIQIQLPESRDPAVYDALFRSLRAHLLDE
jgi:hypothetical protein